MHHGAEQGRDVVHWHQHQAVGLLVVAKVAEREETSHDELVEVAREEVDEAEEQLEDGEAEYLSQRLPLDVGNWVQRILPIVDNEERHAADDGRDEQGVDPESVVGGQDGDDSANHL